MSSVLDVVLGAMKSGQQVEVVYNGGSRPGQSRVLIPLSIDGDDLRAREPLGRSAKSFKLSKVASASLIGGAAVENPDVVPAVIVPAVPAFDNFAECAEHLKSFLPNGPWHTEVKEQAFYVFPLFKNGKPKKTPIVSIQFIDRSVAVGIDWDTGEFVEEHKELTGHEKPWRVDSHRWPQGKSFARMSKAAEVVAQELQALT